MRQTGAQKVVIYQTWGWFHYPAVQLYRSSICMDISNVCREPYHHLVSEPLT